MTSSSGTNTSPPFGREVAAYMGLFLHRTTYMFNLYNRLRLPGAFSVFLLGMSGELCILRSRNRRLLVVVYEKVSEGRLGDICCHWHSPHCGNHIKVVIANICFGLSHKLEQPASNFAPENH